MKNLFLTLIGIGGLGTIGTTTYSIVSETNKRTKRSLVNKKELKKDLEKNVEELFQKTKEKMITFSNKNPIFEKYGDPGKPELTLKKLQEFFSGLLTEDNPSLSEDKLVKLIDENKRNEIEKICLEIEDFIEKIKEINDKKDNLKKLYEKKLNFSLEANNL